MAALNYNKNAPPDVSFKGQDTVVGVNGESSAIAFGDVCYLSAEGTYKLAKADGLTTMPGVVVCVTPGGIGAL